MAIEMVMQMLLEEGVRTLMEMKAEMALLLVIGWEPLVVELFE